ncbi:MAG: cupin-like domain-containing protein [Asticcacaulis sp.]|nr:cupin-like domain-containing protein [Asticcacaulis sp.]
MSSPVELHDLPPVAEVAGVTPDVFVNDIMPKARPVLMRGLVAAWPAVLAARDSDEGIAAYIQAMDNGALTSVLEANASVGGRFDYGPGLHDFNFRRRSRQVSDGVRQLIDLKSHPNPPYVYIQSVPTPQHLPRFSAENQNPLLSPRIVPRIWISNATRAQTHNDQDHNIACVVAGRRRFTLFPPEQVANLYIGPYDHTPSGRAISLASLENPDFTAHPRFAEALKTAQVADMMPGDALYVPKYWWHHVQSMTPFNVLVNYWWGGAAPAENPHTTFLSALLTLKDLPESERSYWKAMFDHYLFQTGGDPVGHIPPAHQGALGKVSPAVRQDLLRTLQQIFAGRV